MDSKTLVAIIRASAILVPKPQLAQKTVSCSELVATMVEPLDHAMIGECKYTIRISPKSRSLEPTLMITLRGYGRTGIEMLMIGMPKDMPQYYAPCWVNDAANDMMKCYAMTGVDEKRLPNHETLRRLIATRIEYYLRGGSAQRHDN